MPADWLEVEELMKRADAIEARLDALEGKTKSAPAPETVTSGGFATLSGGFSGFVPVPDVKAAT